jgi:hypothetical protein
MKKASLILTFIIPGLVTSFTVPSLVRHTSPAAKGDVISNQRSTADRTVFSKLFALNGETNGEVTKKKIVVLGGDGFCGWPTSLYLSDKGHDVIIIDNLSRRKIDIELGCDSLTPIQSPDVRNRIVDHIVYHFIYSSIT